MIILIGMWLCVLYCVIKFLIGKIGFGRKTSFVIFGIIIFVFFTLIGSDAGHIGLGMGIGGAIAFFGILCVLEGEKRLNNEKTTKEEIDKQNHYDDDMGFNDFN